MLGVAAFYLWKKERTTNGGTFEWPRGKTATPTLDSFAVDFGGVNSEGICV